MITDANIIIFAITCNQINHVNVHLLTMDTYSKFKSLLEYFVAHLEWVVNQDKSHQGYNQYIAPITNFKKVGQGWKGDDIQKQISKWQDYSADTMHINIYAPNPQSKGSYINWKSTYDNIKAIWKNSHIVKLYISTGEFAQAEPEYTKSIESLGLYDGDSPNKTLKKFFDKFLQLHKGMSDIESSCINLLKSNHNLILTGSPGTGKTHLAVNIAKELGATIENGRCDMVQFHPSMDYTDFVEGLRPVKGVDGQSVIFERRNGIFKNFCAAALKNLSDSKKSVETLRTERSIEDSYNMLKSDIESGLVTQIPLKSKGMYMTPSISSQDNILLSAMGSTNYHTVSLNRIKKLADTFDNIIKLEQITNIHKEITEKIGGCNESAYWGLLHFLYQNYTINTTTQESKVECKDYVFIIDEINRGETSKIFGEMFYCIDPGYRGRIGTVKTQYHNLIEPGDEFEDGFFIPENVYIIGTMNDIDRSVENMDFAMRRRFAWKEITAESQMHILDKPHAWSPGSKPGQAIIDELKARMTNLNNAIVDRYKPQDTQSHQQHIGLSYAYQIGPAYFLKYSQYDDFDDLWNYHLAGLLLEYLRGTTNIESKIEWLHQAYNDTAK